MTYYSSLQQTCSTLGLNATPVSEMQNRPERVYFAVSLVLDL